MPTPSLPPQLAALLTGTAARIHFRHALYVLAATQRGRYPISERSLGNVAKLLAAELHTSDPTAIRSLKHALACFLPSLASYASASPEPILLEDIVATVAPETTEPHKAREAQRKLRRTLLTPRCILDPTLSKEETARLEKKRAAKAAEMRRYRARKREGATGTEAESWQLREALGVRELPTIGDD